MRHAGGVVALVLLTALGAEGAGPPAASTDALVTAARSRQERVKSVAVHFKQTLTIPVNGFSKRFLPKARWRGLMPATEQVVTAVNHLVIDGTKARFDDNHPRWSPDNQKVPPRSHLFDGTRGINFWTTSPNPGQGSSYANFHPIWFSQTTTEPLVWTFRGADPLLGGGRIQALSRTGKSGRIEGNESVVFDSGGGGGATFLRYHITAARGHLPVRIEQLRHGGRPDRTTDVTYKPNDICGWVPVRWATREFSERGDLVATHLFEVEELTINEPVSPTLFEIAFPPGTEVEDHTQPGRPRTYIVQPNGSLSEQMVEEPEQQQGETALFGRTATWALLALAALAALAAWLLTRRITPRSSPPR